MSDQDTAETNIEWEFPVLGFAALCFVAAIATNVGVYLWYWLFRANAAYYYLYLNFPLCLAGTYFFLRRDWKESDYGVLNALLLLGGWVLCPATAGLAIFFGVGLIGRMHLKVWNNQSEIVSVALTEEEDESPEKWKDIRPGKARHLYLIPSREVEGAYLHITSPDIERVTEISGYVSGSFINTSWKLQIDTNGEVERID